MMRSIIDRWRKLHQHVLPEELTERVQLLTSAIYDILGCSGITCIDYIITESQTRSTVRD